jgi:hypothetical protein
MGQRVSIQTLAFLSKLIKSVVGLDSKVEDDPYLQDDALQDQ